MELRWLMGVGVVGDWRLFLNCWELVSVENLVALVVQRVEIQTS